MCYTKDSVKTFTFGPLAFDVRNWRGVFFMTDKLKERIAAMPLADAKAANREAWKQKRVNTSICNRHHNWSINGNISIYEDASSGEQIASLVCKETYKRMMRGEVAA